MLDQSYMRYWAADHEQFSRDFHSALVALGRLATNALRKLPGIGSVYVTEPTGRAMIGGLAASASTTLVFLGVGALSIPPGALA